MRIRALVTAMALAAGTVLLVPVPAQAAARVTVGNDQGSATADPTYATTLTVRGSGFQSIKGGHGGIYVFFGTKVPGGYLYVPDSESKANQGFQKFVAFPGSDTADSANGGTIAASGTWSTTLTVPGATFDAVNRSGRAQKVDCRRVTCGIITIGAHGVKNARNETFTPVRFADLGSSKAPAAAPSSAAPSAAAPAAGAGAATPLPTMPATPAKATDAKAVVDPATAVVGRVLSFSGSGFMPGEQLVATLDDGVAAVGPLGAGPSGEIAGVLQLPEGTRPGTHVLRLTGAVSGATPSVNFPVAADPTLTSAAADEAGGVPDWVPLAVVGLASAALVAALVFAAIRIRRMRRPVHAL